MMYICISICINMYIYKYMLQKNVFDMFVFIVSLYNVST